MQVDLRHLSRYMWRSPMSALAAIVTLSLTLGAAASIFAVVDVVLLTPPPFAMPGQLFTVGEVPIDDRAVTAPRSVAYATFEAWRDRARSLASFEAFDGTNLTLTGVGVAERIQATDVTPGFLTLLGVSPALGRTFADDDVGRSVAIVSHAFWRGKLAADPDVIGREVSLGGRPHTVIGVLPEGFVFALGVADVWRPLPVPAGEGAGDGARVLVMARLDRASTSAQLAAALDDVSRASVPPARVLVTNVVTAIAGNRTATLALLAGAVVIAMFIAFANLAGLLIVRSIDRRRELAVRTALGARRSEIARQLLLESGAIVALGTIGGVLLGWWMTPVVADLTLERVGEFATRDVSLSWRVIAGLALLACGCACLCGWLPAVAASRWNVVDVLRRGVTPTARELRARRAFVTGEVALAFVLLVSMSLLGRSLFSLLEMDPGFDPRDVTAAQVSLPSAAYPTDAQVAAFYSTLQAALTERFGSGAAATVDELPLTGSGGRRLVAARPDEAGREAIARTVSASYFDVMRIPVLAGRPFDQRDGAPSPPQVVISRSLADRLFASEVPVGRRIWFGRPAQAAEVIGVVGDVKHRTLEETALPTVYLSSTRAPSNSSVVVVRSGRPASEAIAIVRDEVARLDANLPVYRIRPMTQVVDASPGLPARRLLTSTFTGLALLAVVLSAIGLFGVAAHDVACRRTELTLRAALGANPRRILTATMGRGIAMVATGLAVGSVLSMWAVKALGGVAFMDGQADAASVGVAATVLLATGVAAVLPSALRASRTDPGIVLRGE
jgi:predicted permease